MNKYVLYRVESNLEKYTGKNDGIFYPIYVNYTDNEEFIQDRIKNYKENKNHFRVHKLITIEDEKSYVIFLKDAFNESYKKIFKIV